ncbi:class I SAM-dependent methyltransferase [Actinoplanes sp. N902-109]|uniref:class I SAM-dependent methyltransferase n=1 Tax=Actinoplanes sp. (strain N902-109) TaxID=649831 RepID=UPI0003293824|nr:class I SAM-dependent methyltransferase [Actinoplanes sp. N902-109]AGL12184.1 methyltransferase [Actinoplanes sp. N902-109]AGL16465.1 methyltransferase [Actinoplanes sp. N902-109]
MLKPNVVATFMSGVAEMNADASSTAWAGTGSETYKSANSSIHDYAAEMTERGQLWNWGINVPELSAEIERRSPGFAEYGTDTFSEQLYYLALRDLPKGIDSLTGQTVVEVGCGAGEGLNFLSRLAPGALMTGLDLSPVAIARANGVLARGDSLQYVHGDAEHLPFEDASVDVVINVESSHTYPDLARFFREVARVLRPGGVFSHIDVFTGPRLAKMRLIQAEQTELEWVSDHDISDDVRAAVRARMAKGSKFRKNIEKQRMNPLVRAMTTHGQFMVFGGIFAGYTPPAPIRALARTGVLPGMDSLPMESYRHQIAVRAEA